MVKTHMESWCVHARFLDSVSLCEWGHIFVGLCEKSCAVLFEEVEKSARSSSKKDLYINCRTPDFIRIDGYMHLIQATTGDQIRQCAGVGCSSNVRTECKKFNLGLCIACFTPFHEHWNSHIFFKTTRISIRRNIALDIPEKEFINIFLLSFFAM